MFGTQFVAYKVNRGWAWGQELSLSKHPGYVGYVPLKALSDTPSTSTHIVTAMKAPAFTKPNIKSQISMILPLNARLEAQAKRVSGDDFIRCESGYIHMRHVRALKSNVKEIDFVDIAEAHLGLPYIWGGISSDGLDCSGLVQSALRATGSDSARDSDQQAKIGISVNDGQPLKRGDLVFWKGHVGIMQSSDHIIHANAYHMCVESEPLSDAMTRIQAIAGPVTDIRRLDI